MCLTAIIARQQDIHQGKEDNKWGGRTIQFYICVNDKGPEWTEITDIITTIILFDFCISWFISH